VLVSVSSPISPVVDHLADLALWEAELAADPQEAACSLAHRLATVPDPRAVRGRRHPLVVILVLTACATLVVGNDGVAAIWQWAAGTSQEVLQRIGARFDALAGRYLVPSERTFRRVLAGLDADALDAAACGYTADVTRGISPAPVLPAPAGPAEREHAHLDVDAGRPPLTAGEADHERSRFAGQSRFCNISAAHRYSHYHDYTYVVRPARLRRTCGIEPGGRGCHYGRVGVGGRATACSGRRFRCTRRVPGSAARRAGCEDARRGRGEGRAERHDDRRH
jgi:hypothetical protein